MSTCNGWANYETWKTSLELLDGYDVADFMHDCRFVFPDDRDDAVAKLAQHFEDYAHDVASEQARGWALDLVGSFLSCVDWHEIASHYVDDYASDLASR